MNIFVLDRDPEKAAEYACDKHVVKMVTETAQILSTACHVAGVKTDGLYKPCYINHPPNVWARKRENFLWLYLYGSWLSLEYFKRYKKTHKAKAIIDVARLRMDDELKNTIITYNNINFIQCMPDQYKQDDPVEAYRTYYIHEKRDFAKWNHGPTPWWWK